MLKITTPCFVKGGWIPDFNSEFAEDNIHRMKGK